MLRRVLYRLGPIAARCWFYVAVPMVAAITDWVEDPEMGAYRVAARFGIVFALIASIGLPLQVFYWNFGSRLFAERFQWREVPIHALAVALAVGLGTEIAIASILFFADPSVEVPPEKISSFRRAVWLGGCVIAAAAVGVVSALERYRGRIAQFEEREAEARRAALVAQVQALQARIQPHFLFNCLNTVAGLIPEDPARAEAAIVKLSDLFRYSLEASEDTTVPLESELAVVRDFLELEELRYGERLQSRLHIDPAAREVPVPPLVLQPAVENAVLHGISKRREGGQLQVEAHVEGTRLHLAVEDDGPGPGQSSHVGSGKALENLRRRLMLLYGDEAGVREEHRERGGYRLSIWLPTHPTSPACAAAAEPAP